MRESPFVVALPCSRRPRSSVEGEVNFIALLALLAFGSGWDAELRATGERRRPAGDGAADLALRGLFSLHISGRVRPRRAEA